MCDRIIMPDGTEIESIVDGDACLCGSSHQEILTWIVQHIEEFGIDEWVEIAHTPFGYEVKIGEIMKFLQCVDCERYELVGGSNTTMRHCVCTKDCNGENHFKKVDAEAGV